MQYINLIFKVMLVLVMLATPALAKVSVNEAAKLKSGALTPFGSEKAGNADGSIPAWTGGLTPDKAPAAWQAVAPNGARPDPFATEKPLFVITAQNMDQYADRLTEGQKNLLKSYPEAYKMPVYPSHRSAALPEWINENTFKNATRNELTDGGNGIAKAFGGTPFPFPQNGHEVVWNHLVRFRGETSTNPTVWAWTYPNGKSKLQQTDVVAIDPYYDSKGSLEDFDGGLFRFFNLINSPIARAGEIQLVHDAVNAKETPRAAWRYSPGERRVRRAPTIAFDTPNNEVSTYDDYWVFNGSPERYDFKLVGKKEIYVPYNNYRVAQRSVKYKDIMTPLSPNSELLRYELHRVWVVEASLKDGKRHLYSKRTFYVDEDSWNISAVDEFDGKGNLYRVIQNYLTTYYDVPLTLDAMIVHWDLKNSVYGIVNLSNEEKHFYDFTQKHSSKEFTSQGLRRKGTR